MKKAFSLIELLIVITIIGILAVAFLPSITTGPSRARDVQRVSDISDIALALELYFQDTGGYPLSASGEELTSTTGTGLLLVSYFDNNAVPTDPQTSAAPINTTYAGGYFYKGAANSYTLIADVENGKVAEGYCVMPTSVPTLPFNCTELTSATGPYNFNTANAAYVLSKG